MDIYVHNPTVEIFTGKDNARIEFINKADGTSAEIRMNHDELLSLQTELGVAIQKMQHPL